MRNLAESLPEAIKQICVKDFCEVAPCIQQGAVERCKAKAEQQEDYIMKPYETITFGSLIPIGTSNG